MLTIIKPYVYVGSPNNIKLISYYYSLIPNIKINTAELREWDDGLRNALDECHLRAAKNTKKCQNEYENKLRKKNQELDKLFTVIFLQI